MDVQVVQMSPLAVYNAMYYDQRLDGTTMIVDLGAENTDLIIADGETVWLRTIPIGGNNFSEVLAKQFKLSSAKAEELKRNARTSKYARQIFQAMRPIFADLVAEIQRSIGFYASVHRESRIKRIIALGGTFRLPTLMKYLQQNLQIEVTPIDGLGGGAPLDGKLATMLNENVISMAGAYGLAVQAMGGAKITSSLLPEPIRRAKIWREKTKWFAAAAAIMVLGTAGVVARYYLDSANYTAQKDVRATLDNTLKNANKLSQDWDALSHQGAPDRQKIRNVSSMVDYRNVWPSLVSDIRSTLPPTLGDANAIKAKFPLRTSRDLIMLTGWFSAYHENLGALTDPNTLNNAAFDTMVTGAGAEGVSGYRQPTNFGNGPMAGQGMPGRGGMQAPPVEEEHGFLLRLEGATPNSGGASYLNVAIITKLKAMNKLWAVQNGRPYYVKRVTIASCDQVSKVAAMGASGMPFRPQPQPGALGPTGQLAAVQDVDPFFDPLFGESGGKDYAFKIGVAVVLDPSLANKPPTAVAKAQ
jgi:hypothetical protein